MNTIGRSSKAHSRVRSGLFACVLGGLALAACAKSRTMPTAPPPEYEVVSPGAPVPERPAAADDRLGDEPMLAPPVDLEPDDAGSPKADAALGADASAETGRR